MTDPNAPGTKAGEAQATSIPPVTVTVIGTGDGAVPIPSGTVLQTPDHQPNVIYESIQPIVAIAVRFANLFLTTFVGLVVAAMTPVGGKLLYTSDFFHLVVVCASLALPGAAIGFFKDLVTIFGKLEQKYPLATGSI